MSQLPEKTPAPTSQIVIHAETKPVVKMPAPKAVAPVRVGAIRMESQGGIRWGRWAEALVFAVLAGGAGYYVAQQLFLGVDQEVTKPVGPVAALLSPVDASPAPAIDSSAPATK